jgi:hypothetical protein
MAWLRREVYHGRMTAKLLLVAVLGLALVSRSGAPVRNPEPRPAAAHPDDQKPAALPPVDFQTQIRPILESRWASPGCVDTSKRPHNRGRGVVRA